MIQPSIPIQLIIPFLVEVELMVPPQGRIGLAVPVEVGRMRPTAIAVVHVQRHAFSNIDEDADVASAFRHVLLAAA